MIVLDRPNLHGGGRRVRSPPAEIGVNFGQRRYNNVPKSTSPYVGVIVDGERIDGV
jgi:hypothetical protein